VLVLRMVQEQFHRDAEDRPIREGRLPRELLRDGEIEYRQCPYAGSRYLNERPMNVSALRQTSAHWDEIVATLAFLRSAYAHARGGYRADTLDIWRVGQLGSSLPWFYILHEGTTCPAHVAALSKATLGVGIWGWRVFVDMLKERKVIARFTSQLMLDTAESTDTLVADHEVCAASDKMMLKFFDVLTAASVDGSDNGQVGHLVVARDEVLRFGSHYIAFKQWLWMYWLARRVLYAELQLVLGPQAELVERMDPTGEPPDFFVLEPSNIAELDLSARAQWFESLASLVEPFAPDGSDAVMRDHARMLASIMSQPPARLDDIATEVANVTGLGSDGSQRVARAIGTYAALDALQADVMASVEIGFRGQPDPQFDRAMRDAVIRMPPRALFTQLAPALVAEITRP
jgi:hypothetical protein